MKRNFHAWKQANIPNFCHQCPIRGLPVIYSAIRVAQTGALSCLLKYGRFRVNVSRVCCFQHLGYLAVKRNTTKVGHCRFTEQLEVWISSLSLSIARILSSLSFWSSKTEVSNIQWVEKEWKILWLCTLTLLAQPFVAITYSSFPLHSIFNWRAAAFWIDGNTKSVETVGNPVQEQVCGGTLGSPGPKGIANTATSHFYHEQCVILLSSVMFCQIFGKFSVLESWRYFVSI